MSETLPDRLSIDPRSPYYDQSLINGVAKLYARDLELFDYQF